MTKVVNLELVITLFQFLLYLFVQFCQSTDLTRKLDNPWLFTTQLSGHARPYTNMNLITLIRLGNWLENIQVKNTVTNFVQAFQWYKILQIIM